MKAFLKFLVLIVLLIPGPGIHAQKKLVPVAQSVLTGITLPAGSQQDKRWMSENAAKVLLEMESRKVKTKVKNPEVLYLPSVANCGFNTDSLVTQLSGLGWEIMPIEADNKFAWLQKNGRYIIAYFLMEKTQTQMYFAESIVVPAIE